MIDKIKEVLTSFKNTQVNLDSDSAIETMAEKINETINQELEIERMKLSEQIVEHYGDGYCCATCSARHGCGGRATEFSGQTPMAGSRMADKFRLSQLS